MQQQQQFLGCFLAAEEGLSFEDNWEMFSSNKKAKDVKKRSAKPNEDMMNMFGFGPGAGADMDDDEESLEAELAALQGRTAAKKKPQKKEKLMSMDEISKLAADSMKDFNEDDMSDDDIDDEDLLAELHELAPDVDADEEEVTASAAKEPQTSPKSSYEASGIVNMISERKAMYMKAHECAMAESASSKVRRMERGIKELDKLLKDARGGKNVKEDDLPPPVAVKASSQTPVAAQENQADKIQEAPSPINMPRESPANESVREPTRDKEKPVATEENKIAVTQKVADGKDNESTLKMLTTRRDQYKMAALAKKREGDVPSAKHFLAICKQFDPVIAAIESGQAVDLSRLPPPPTELQDKPATPVAKAPSPAPVTEESPKTTAQAASQDTGSPPAPASILEALQQRLEKYQQASNQANEEGNSSKARRMGRIAKQYQDAIRDHKRGKPVNFDELPSPPGFAPIPVPGATSLPNSTADQPTTSSPPAVKIAPAQVAPVQHPVPQIEVNAGSSETMSRNQKELQFLLTRQKEFKMAALQAKRDGDLESAKFNLKQSKGLDEMIVAAQSGLRVDITTVPSLKKKEKKTSESPEDAFSHVQSVTVASEPTPLAEDAMQLYARLEMALKKQIQTSTKNAEHYRLLGDLAAAKNFDTLHHGSQQDLDTLIMSKAHGDPVPKFHYEMKSFPIVRSHPELSDSELEINIIRCINIPLPSGYQPKDMYTYISYEFPFPSETPQTGSTSVSKGTINPEFNQTFKVSVDRKSRALARIFRRQPLNLKIMYQRGFLKSDKTLAQSNIKLENFNNKSTIHECVELMDTDRGRKPVGGKIEVMLKIREPLVDKDVEVVNERWLVMDSHLRTLQMESSTMKKSPSLPRTEPAAQYKSLEVSKFDKDLIEKQINAIKAQGKNVPSSLVQKLENSQVQIREIQMILKNGGEPALDYMKQLKTGIEIEKAKAHKCLQNGERTEAKLCLARKKLLDKEIAALRGQQPS